ncbi:MAG: hypothetical protein UV23_C0023G0011 [Candidatus Nomurabacteria bacterium GW2011_GWF1_42_40]|nr:MAG: hypothetical protein UV23_C0023G0011 [Candidatus Nomurabacteria bacterium GW2011_GWF1_42_40]
MDEFYHCGLDGHIVGFEHYEHDSNNMYLDIPLFMLDVPTRYYDNIYGQELAHKIILDIMAHAKNNNPVGGTIGTLHDFGLHKTKEIHNHNIVDAYMNGDLLMVKCDILDEDIKDMIRGTSKLCSGGKVCYYADLVWEGMSAYERGYVRVLEKDFRLSSVNIKARRETLCQ